MKNEKQPKRLNRIATIGTGLFLAAAGTGMALEASAVPAFAQDGSGVSTLGSPKPEASAQAQAAFTILDGGSFLPAEERSLPANTVITGDPVLIDGKAFSDTNAFSGATIILNQEADVKASADYGFSYHTFATAEEAKTQAIAEAGDGIFLGCGDGCQVVDVLPYPGMTQKEWDNLGRPENSNSGIITVRADGTTSQPAGSPEATANPEATKAPELTDPTLIKEYVDANPNMDSSVALDMLNTLIKNGFDVNAAENQEVLAELIACICKCQPTEVPMPTATPKPTATPEPSAVPCDDIQDIDHPYKGWNANGFDRSKASKEFGQDITRAIFQSDGAWKMHGTKTWHTSYDNDGTTAQIYVFDFAKEKQVDFSFDWGGDLQEACVTLPDSKFEDRLSKDLQETFKNQPNTDRIKVTTITANGTSSKWVSR